LIPEINADSKSIQAQWNKTIFYSTFRFDPNSIEISNGIWGGVLNLAKELINNEITKDNIRFFLGYTGWENN
jgi:putative transcriptional regulator